MSAERPEPLSSSEYFSKLSLADIYGKATPKPGTMILTDIPAERIHNTSYEESQAIIIKYGLPSIAGWMQKQDVPFLYVNSGLGSELTDWAPQHSERTLLRELAFSLSGGKTPLILDVGCGTGFVSKLLAAEEDLKVVGIDPLLSKLGQAVPPTTGELILLSSDIFDLVENYGPAFQPEAAQERRALLEELRPSFGENKHYLTIAGYIGENTTGFGDKFSLQISRLQELAQSNEVTLQTSPIDLVVCSFMSAGAELTVPIRDGVHPKGIVYVRPTEWGHISGVGDYYKEFDWDHNDAPEADFATSFNPGRNYRTVARWKTFWQNDWGDRAYEFSYEPSAEVVVQIRKDVRPESIQLKSVPPQRYSWDDEIEEVLRENDRLSEEDLWERRAGFEEFVKGLEEAQKKLFKPS